MQALHQQAEQDGGPKEAMTKKRRYPNQPDDGHAHHWVIPAAPARPNGRCKFCGAQKGFNNSTPVEGFRPSSGQSKPPADLTLPGETTES